MLVSKLHARSRSPHAQRNKLAKAHRTRSIGNVAGQFTAIAGQRIAAYPHSRQRYRESRCTLRCPGWIGTMGWHRQSVLTAPSTSAKRCRTHEGRCMRGPRPLHHHPKPTSFKLHGAHNPDWFRKANGPRHGCLLAGCATRTRPTCTKNRTKRARNMMLEGAREKGALYRSGRNIDTACHA